MSEPGGCFVLLCVVQPLITFIQKILIINYLLCALDFLKTCCQLSYNTILC